MCTVWASANIDRQSVGNLDVCYVCGPRLTQELWVYENTGVAIKHPKKGLFLSTRCDKNRVGLEILS